MSLLDAVRSRTGAPARDRRPVLTRPQLGVLWLALAVLLAGALALVLGPGRGLRTDIVNVSDDLDASRDGIFLQLGTLRSQLDVTEQSLEVQESGLAVAVEAERDATVAAESTQALLEETRATLQLVREVTRSLGPDLGEELGQALRVAQQTLVVAQQTLSTGREALAVARDTLATLRRSEELQRELLRTAEEINRKIPGAPVFPSAP